MSNRFAVVAVLTAGLVAGTWAADDNKDKSQEKDRGMEATRKYIKDLDKNNDGTLSRDELPADLRDGFNDVDADKNGQLTANELEHHAERMARTATPVEVVSIWVVEADTHAPSQQELQNVYNLLRTADKNNDGQLSPDEIRAAREQAVEKRMDAICKRCDKNNDGKISKDEACGPLAVMFDRTDKNRDGFVTADELKECCSMSGQDHKAAAGGSK